MMPQPCRTGRQTAPSPDRREKVIKRSTRSISRPTVTFMTRSMRCCRLARIVAVPKQALGRRCAAIRASPRRKPSSSGRAALADPVEQIVERAADQNVSSKLVAACCSRRMRRSCRK
jgi:hypothetical protein